MVDSELQAEAAQAGASGTLKRHWRFILRLAIYGLLLAIVSVVLLSLFCPIADPEAVRRAANDAVHLKKPPKMPDAQFKADSTTEVVVQTKDTSPTLIAADNIRGIFRPYANPYVDPDFKWEQASCTKHIQDRVLEIRSVLDDIDVLSQTQDYRKTGDAIANLKHEVDALMNFAEYGPNQIAGVQKNDAPDWVKEGIRLSLDLRNEFAQHELEHYVRHGHWAAAAKLCEHRGDYRQSIYYWRKVGGYDGRLRSVLGGLSIPLNVLRIKPQGWIDKSIPDRIFFVGLPDEDETANMQNEYFFHH